MPLCSIGEAAKQLGYKSRSQIYRMISDGWLDDYLKEINGMTAQLVAHVLSYSLGKGRLALKGRKRRPWLEISRCETEKQYLNFQLKTYLYGPAKESNVVKEAITQLYSKKVFTGLDDTQIAMSTANVRVVQVPNPSTADADDAYTVTETQTDNI